MEFAIDLIVAGDVKNSIGATSRRERAMIYGY
jgi:hypothetical protein